jgi:hypothetical protein
MANLWASGVASAAGCGTSPRASNSSMFWFLEVGYRFSGSVHHPHIDRHERGPASNRGRRLLLSQ